MKGKLTIIGAILVMLLTVIGAIVAMQMGVEIVSGEISSGWTKTYGGTSGDWGWSLVQTSDGGYAIAGYTYSYGAGFADVWLVKTDSDGNQQWNKTYGGTNEDQVYSVVQTSDGGYALAGRTSSFGAGYDDFWLVKTDELGVIPEYQPLFVLPVFAALTIVAVIIARKRLPRRVGI